jgi:hypothetical protein
VVHGLQKAAPFVFVDVEARPNDAALADHEHTKRQEKIALAAILNESDSMSEHYLPFVCFVGHCAMLFSLFPQALSGEFDEDVFERGALQLDIGQLDTLLVNPLHQLDQRLCRPRRLDGQHLAVSADRGF